jgi:alpha/beta hydrolase family protein
VAAKVDGDRTYQGQVQALDRLIEVAAGRTPCVQEHEVPVPRTLRVVDDRDAIVHAGDRHQPSAPRPRPYPICRPGHPTPAWPGPGAARRRGFNVVPPLPPELILRSRALRSRLVPWKFLKSTTRAMEDLAAVLDAVGSERPVLFGASDSGALCALYAATYPERIMGLIMFGTAARGTPTSDYPWAWTDEHWKSSLSELAAVGERTSTQRRPSSGSHHRSPRIQSNGGGG